MLEETAQIMTANPVFREARLWCLAHVGRKTMVEKVMRTWKMDVCVDTDIWKTKTEVERCHV